MQILRATSRSINKDRLYQSQQDRNKQIHLQKIKIITATHLQPLKSDSTIQNRLRKAKSAAKIFQKQQEKLNLRLENKSLLTKLVNIQSTLKPIRNSQISEINKLYGTSSNWLQRKRQEQKTKKENQFLNKRYTQIANTDVKDLKKKMQSSIREYLQLRDSIRKIKPLRTSESKKRERSLSHKKITISLPLSSPYIIMMQLNNQEQVLPQKDDKVQYKFQNQIHISNSQPQQSSISNQNESHPRDPFKEIKKFRQLKNLNSSDNGSISNKKTSNNNIKIAQQIIE